MSERIKRVFSDNSQIAHLWMSGTQSAARNPGNNFYYDGAIIYSYGSHFPIARKVYLGANPIAARPDCVLLTTERYSNTTAKHIHDVRLAIRGAFYSVPNVLASTKDEHRSNLNAYRESAAASLKASENKRCKEETRERSLEDARRIVTEAERYRVQFKLGGKPVVVEGLKESVEKAKAAEDRRTTKERKEREKREAERKAAAETKAAEYLAEWLGSGIATNVHFGREIRPIQFRLRVIGPPASSVQIVETTMGAYVPAEAARQLYDNLCIALNRPDGEAQREGMLRRIEGTEIGDFRIDSIYPHGEDWRIEAGCHSLLWSVMQSFAESIGWDKAST